METVNYNKIEDEWVGINTVKRRAEVVMGLATLLLISVFLFEGFIEASVMGVLGLFFLNLVERERNIGFKVKMLYLEAHQAYINLNNQLQVVAEEIEMQQQNYRNN
jgi:hypothetical protein